MGKVLAGFVILMLSFFQNGLAQITFQKTYGGGGSDAGNCVVQTTDDGYIVAGNTNSFPEAQGGIYLVRTNASGDTMWTRTYGGINNWEHAACMIQANDGGFVFAGAASSFGNGQEDVYVVKISGDGSLLWSVTIGDSLNDRANWIEQTREGNYIITGFTQSISADGLEAYLILLDNTGNLVWTKTYSLYTGERGKFVKQTNDNGFIILGETNDGNNKSKVLLIKTDGDGNETWAKSFDAIQGNSVVEDNDGNFLITGKVLVDTAYRLYLYKVSNNGSFLWAKLYNESGGNTVLESTDGGFWLLGESSELIKTDNQGNVEWAWRSGNANVQNIEVNMCNTNDHGLIITGMRYIPDSEFDLFLYKTDSAGKGGCTDMPINLTASDYLPQIEDQFIVVSSGGSIFIPSTNVNKVNTSVQTWYLPGASFTYYEDTLSTVHFYNYSTNVLTWRWEFGDGQIDSTHTSPSHTYSDTGNFNVCLKVKNNCGSDSLCRMVYVSKPGAVEKLNSSPGKVYPNPAKDWVFIEFSNLQAGDHSIRIYNSWGSQVFMEDRIKGNFIRIERNALPSGGSYFIMVTDNKGHTGSAKLIVE